MFSCVMQSIFIYVDFGYQEQNDGQYSTHRSICVVHSGWGSAVQIPVISCEWSWLDDTEKEH